MLSIEQSLTASESRTLKSMAREAIYYGLLHKRTLPVHASVFSSALQARRSSFVTLRIRGELRGCVGSLEAAKALIEDVALNAHNAAFEDPRFPPLTTDEFNRLSISISVLTPHQEMSVESEEDLLAQIRPGVDGIIIADDSHRATLLPSVWDSVNSSREFLSILKRKAGLPPDYWSPKLSFRKYQTEIY